MFDGISCGAQALKNLGFQNVQYYARIEVEETAIEISRHNFPDIIQLGDVTDITDTQIERLGPFDLVLAGSPCQDLAKGKDKQGFTGERSALFSEFVRLLNACKRYNPKVSFLFENVNMLQEQQNAVSQMLGCDPVLINSNLVSGQSRKRLYWMNFQTDEIQDRNITLASILNAKGETYPKNCSLTLSKDEQHVHVVYNGGETAQLADDFFRRNMPTHRRLHVIADVRSSKDKSNTVTTETVNRTASDGSTTIVYKKNGTISCRGLSVSECEKLQGLPKNYTKVEGISKSKRGFHIGNGWTVAVIEEILSCLPYQS